MRLTPNSPSRRAAGFSLVELMVAMAAGLIIIGAAVTFAVSTIRSYSENILSSRLTQELRTGMNLVVRELRRAGHDSTSVTRVLTTSSASAFTTLEVEDDCVGYEYDRQDGVEGVPDESESRSFRVSGGVLQMNVTGGCDSADDWEDITDPDVVQITKFDPVLVESTFCAQIAERDNDPDPAVEDMEYDMAFGSVKTISMCLQGQMASGDAITRYVTDSVRIRAEDLEFELATTDNTCEPGTDSENPMSPVDLNDECATIAP